MIKKDIEYGNATTISNINKNKKGRNDSMVKFAT